MATRKIQVDLTFNTDTTAAKKQIENLQQSLNKVASTPLDKNMGLDNLTNQAVALKVALNNATNVNTGKLNFKKFEQELAASRINLKQFASDLTKLGPEGQKALLDLASAVRSAEAPFISLNGALKKLGTTFANTIRWQITASITTGMYSAFQGVIDYSERLNKSLNEIRIVTGKNVDTMARFADEAQRSAKALNSSTLDYTKAALIYYQQGLGDSEVKERTDATVKLANVVGESANTVSEWMTSIWNNFDDGSKKLEYYADVLAKLGAATASSADEIAGGLEKFSAVANTVGLSYEYAAAAVTTMTAATRQSEDIVGTSLKTMFARMEDLSLGKTLDDGTSLGTYSGELAKAGVQVTDIEGNLRDMDDILDDIMDRWSSLSRAQQVALAQSVAGVRQYAQFMSLIDNSSAFKQNVEWAKDSTGELEQQQLIWEESVKGAQGRLKNSTEELKNVLMDENFLIPFINGLSTLTSGVADLVDAFGGLRTILLAILPIALKIWGEQATKGLRSVGLWVQGTLSGQNASARQATMAQEITEFAKGGQMGEKTSKAYGQMAEGELQYTKFLNENNENLTSAEKDRLNVMQQIVKAKHEEAFEAAQVLEKTENDLEKTKEKLNSIKRSNEEPSLLEQTKMAIQFGKTPVKLMNQPDFDDPRWYSTLTDSISNVDTASLISERQAGSLYNLTDSRKKALEDYKKVQEEIKNLEKETENIETTKRSAAGKKGAEKRKLDQGKIKKSEYNTAIKDQDKVIEKASENQNKLNRRIDELKEKEENLERQITRTTEAIKKNINTINNSTTAVEKLKKENARNADDIDKYIELTEKQQKQSEDYEEIQEDANDKQQKFLETQEEFIARGKDWAANTIDATAGITQMGTAASIASGGVQSLIEALGTGEVTIGNFLSSLLSITMAIPTFLQGYQQVAEVIDRANKAKQASIALDKKETGEKVKNSGKKALASIKEAIAGIGPQFAVDPLGATLKLGAILTIAAVAGVSIGSGIASANSQNAEEKSSQKNETFTETQEKASSNEELLKNYRQLKYQYDQTGEGADKLAQASQELASAYGEEGSALLKLSGDYEQFNKTIQKKRTEETDKLINDARVAIESSTIGKAARKGLGKRKIGDSLTVDLFNDTGWGYSRNAQKTLTEAIKALPKEQQNLFSSFINGNGHRLLQFSTDYDPRSIAESYDILQKLVTEATKVDKNFTQTKEYDAIMKYLIQIKDKAAEVNTQIETETKAVMEQIFDELGPDKIKSVANIQEFYKTVKDRMGDSFDEDTFNDLISSYTEASEFNIYRQAIQEQNEKNEKLTINELTKLYENSSEAFAGALAKVDVSTVTDTEDLKQKAIELLGESAENIAKAAAGKYGKTSVDEETYAQILKDNNDKLKHSSRLLHEVAGASITLNGELETLVKTWNDYNEALLTGNVNSTEYAYAVRQMSKSIKSLFGITNENVNLDNLVRTNKDLISKFLDEGDLKAYEKIESLVSQEVARTLGVGQQLDSFLTYLFSKQYKAGDLIELGTFKAKLNEMLKDGELTAQALRQILSAQNIEVDFTVDKTGTATIDKMFKTFDSSLFDTSFVKKQQEARKKRLKDLKDEIERYHEINEALEDTENQLDAISKAKDRAFGPDKLKYIDQELAKQKELLNLEKQKTQEAQNYYKADRAAILKYGASLDSSGRITNYDELFAAQVNALNAKVGNDDAYEKQSEAYEKFKKAVSQYEETLNLIEDQQQKVVDMQNELADLALEKIQFQVEFKIAIEDDKLKYIEFLIQKLDDDSFAAAESIGLLGREASSALTKIKAAEEGISTIMADVRSSGIMTDAQAEALRDYRDNIIDLNSQLLELRNTVQDKLTAAFDVWQEKLDKNTSKLTHLRNLVNNYKNIIDIVGKDNLGISDETMEKIRVVQMKTANDQLSAAKAAMDATKKTLSQYEAARNAASIRGDQESVKEWDKQIDAVEEKLRELTENFQTTWADALQVVADAFESRVDQIIENFSESVSGIYKNLDELSEFMEREKEIDERYLDNFEKVYEINKLNREVNSSISNAASEVTAKKLRDFQEDLLAMQKEGVNVSKYDVEFMQKKYDLLVAEAALQDAQNAKSVVRLRRDSEGNFGYIYTADQDNVTSAQQKYDDALYAMQKFGKESLQTAQEQIIGLNKAYADAIKQLEADTTLNREEKAKKMAELTQYYSEQLRYWVDEANKRTQEGLDINTSFNAGMAESFEQTLLQKIFPDIRNWETLYETSQSNMQKAGQEFVDACKQYSVETGESFDKAGQKANDMDTTISNALKDISDKSEETADDTETMVDNMVSAIGKAITAVEDFQRTYSSQMQTIRSANQQTIESVNKLIEKYQGMINAAEEATKVDLFANNTPKVSGAGGGGDKTGDNGGSTQTPTKKTYQIQNIEAGTKTTMYKVNNKWYTSSQLGMSSTQQRAAKKGYNLSLTDDQLSGGSSSAYDTISLKGASLKEDGAGNIRRYDESGNGGKLFYGAIGKNNLVNLQRLSIVGYKYDKSSNTNLYKLSDKFNWGSANKTTYWLNQTDLHQLLGQSGQSALYKRYNLKALDTGGYTGSWGTDGRLALLHQKELVLNSSDTENFLSAVSILRDITSQIDLQAASMSYNNILDSTRFTAGAQRDTLEQNVTIHAEFPNATDHTEIEQAFQNLSNLASQYAGRKV